MAEFRGCHLCKDAPKDLDALKGAWCIEPKADGVRCLAVKEGGRVTLFSRNGTVYRNFGEIEAFLEQHLRDGYVLDGEIVHQTLRGPSGFALVNRRALAAPGRNLDGAAVRFAAFDAMIDYEWTTGVTGDTRSRRATLKHVAATLPDAPEFSMVPRSAPTGSAEEIRRRFQRAVAQGFEGVVLKRPGAAYAFGKADGTWLRIKAEHTVDLRVVGMDAGRGELAGTLGALLCEGLDAGRPIRCRVSAGITAADRWNWWLRRDRLDGLDMVEVAYKDMTLARDASVFSLSQPRFIRARAAVGGVKL